MRYGRFMKIAMKAEAVRETITTLYAIIGSNTWPNREPENIVMRIAIKEKEKELTAIEDKIRKELIF